MEPLIGPYGGVATEILDEVVDAGANAIWFHGFNERHAEGCASRGVAACVELKTFRADFAARPELVPVGVDGEPIRYGRLVQGVCLSQTAFLDEIEDTIRRGLAVMAPRGIWLDYLSYGGWFEDPDPDLQPNCFCADCVREFCSATDTDTESPTEILRSHGGEWVDHQCRRIAGLAARYVGVIRATLPECVIGAYMCPWRPEEFGGALRGVFGQDYGLLAPHIDVFTPLIYAKKCGRGPEWGREFLEGSGDFVPAASRVQPILDTLDFPDSLVETAMSSVPSWGVQLFAGAEVFRSPDTAAEFARAADRIRGAWSGS